MKKNFRLIYPPDCDTSAERRMKDYSFVHSLQIDDMVVIKQESYRGFSDLHLENYFSMDPAVLDYRLSVVEDLVENPPLYQAFVDSVTTISNINTLSKVMDSDFSVDSALSSVRYLEMYRDIVELFSGALSDAELRSEGMKSFREQVREIAEGEEYQSLSRELAGTEMDFGYLKSVTIGVNLDENLQPKEAGILSVNQEEFRPGTVMNRLLKKKSPDGKVLISTLYPLARGLHGEELKALNHGISTSLRTIFAKSLRDFEPLIQNYYKVSTAPFVSLLDDIRFLTAGAEFILKMRELGFPMCRPRIASMEEKRCDLKQVYNPILALREVEKTVVSNSFTLDERGRFYLVTGPNNGVKSIFAYSVGMTQALFQLGLFVPAESAYMSPVSGIYTHFPASDENNYGKGRLESECARLGAIMKKLTETDMLLMDESFSSTSGLEAGYIASEVLTGIGVIGCCGIFVTHIHDLPLKVDEFNAHPGNKSKIDNLVAQMENRENGVRSYRVLRTKPDGLSYARDIAKQYGLDLEDILHNR
ncbi:MAG: hypothetical protein LUE92_10195 [Clostridiales bacterium]|nr:hypothetical protein [Clostridiales bacterium]